MCESAKRTRIPCQNRGLPPISETLALFLAPLMAGGGKTGFTSSHLANFGRTWARLLDKASVAMSVRRHYF